MVVDLSTSLLVAGPRCVATAQARGLDRNAAAVADVLRAKRRLIYIRIRNGLQNVSNLK